MMNRLPLAELERRCQKPDHRHLGNWMARCVARPAALRITWVIAPWGVSAHAATLAAWLCGAGAAAALARGSVAGWLCGAALLQLWYLLDHVDGQLARLRGTASLDGVQLDYLMHHTINLLVPLGVGYGIAVGTAAPAWGWLGLACGLALLLLTLQHDARYKAFVQRLKRLRGELRVIGGGGGRPVLQPPLPSHPLRLAAWAARKSCEIHVIANTLAVVAVAQWVFNDVSLYVGRGWLAVIGPTAVAVAVWTIGRSQRNAAAEKEFAEWYRPPVGSELTFADGWWQVCESRRETDTAFADRGDR